MLEAQRKQLPGAVQAKEQEKVKETSHAPAFPEQSIKDLEALGYSRADAIEALEVSDGNAEAAALYLLDRK